MKQVTIMLSIAVTILLAACSKKDGTSSTTPSSNTNNQPTYTKPTLNAMEKLVVGNWKKSSATEYYSDYTGKKRTTDIMGTCENDDLYAFTDSLTSTVSDGSTICSEKSPYHVSQEWSVDDSIISHFYLYNSQLLFVPPTIIQINLSTMTLKIENKSVLGAGSWVKYEYIYIFKRL